MMDLLSVSQDRLTPNFHFFLLSFLLSLFVATGLRAEPSRTNIYWSVETNAGSSPFVFPNIPFPCQADLGSTSKLEILQGNPDIFAAPLEILQEGRLPSQDIAPDENFSFDASSDGGLIRVNLARASAISEIRIFSENISGRGEQCYKVYGALEGQKDLIVPKDRREIVKDGWIFLAAINSQPIPFLRGPQLATSLELPKSLEGPYQALLFDFAALDSSGVYRNSYLSAINILEPQHSYSKAILGYSGLKAPLQTVIHADSAIGTLELDLDSSQAPELASWLDLEMAPVILRWYPRMAQYLSSPGFQPRRKLDIRLRPRLARMESIHARPEGEEIWELFNGRIEFNTEDLEENHFFDDRGIFIHELTHVLQDYRQWARRTDVPFWLVEGVADYMRLYFYLPDEGFNVYTAKRLRSFRYDAGYNASASFLDFVARHFDPNIVKEENQLCRDANYTDFSWQRFTGKSLAELDRLWRQDLELQAKAMDPGQTAK